MLSYYVYFQKKYEQRSFKDYVISCIFRLVFWYLVLKEIIISWFFKETITMQRNNYVSINFQFLNIMPSFEANVGTSWIIVFPWNLISYMIITLYDYDILLWYPHQGNLSSHLNIPLYYLYNYHNQENYFREC